MRHEIAIGMNQKGLPCDRKGRRAHVHPSRQEALLMRLSVDSLRRVPADHPLRAIRPLIEDRAIRRACRDLYAPIGRPSIPPEQLFLALVGGYLLGVASDRKLVMELQCNMALRWFVGLNLDEQPWDASTFSQNRRRRFARSRLRQKSPPALVRGRIPAAGVLARTKCCVRGCPARRHMTDAKTL